MDSATSPPVNSPPATYLYQLVEAKLGTPLDQFILRRYQGTEHSHAGQETCTQKHPHRAISYELIQLTEVDVSHEAVRQWYHQLTGNPGD